MSFEAMRFAKRAHEDHKRKYTLVPYWTHLAEVAGIVATIGEREDVWMSQMVAVAWLHDCVEYCGITEFEIEAVFGSTVSKGVMLLSDLETGNRATRKELSRARLAAAPGWVQTIKCADLISNTSSIVQHDPEFAVLYLKEKRLLLDVMTNADPRLHALARQQAEAA